MKIYLYTFGNVKFCLAKFANNYNYMTDSIISYKEAIDKAYSMYLSDIALR